MTADNFGARDKLARLQLIRSANIGPVTYFQLIARFGTAQAALQAIPELAARGGGRPPRLAGLGDIEREVERVRALGARYLFLEQHDYPALLAEIDNAPPAIIFRGRLELLERPMIALVGARNASAAACRFARGLAQDLGRSGASVVSGLARGIDTAAHEGSLATGTIAVIASGIDIVFPPENAALQEGIAQEGLLFAEQPPGTEPRARHFPYRNRIIAGLAAGTVVVEAAPRSGSLITARLAAESGREVMAVPGSPLDPRAQGCNLLIREGATLIQNAADVMEAVGPMDSRLMRQEKMPFAEEPVPSDTTERERRDVAALLSMTPVAVDEIIRQSSLPPAIVQTVLLELELAGRLDRHAGGRVSLV
ncbi:DNA-processing protein DprA [Rhizorhapis suberifaciens]|uniref:DNA processing protein n=1 Tax=Rhizorhapis suberifaciens TaxID=13656 RepID=A0A840HWZ4_9SPHN|nr:DNA-processing protein DprA [Rhizorhapis suberifaciens]MBB4642100.1 DNA processing protein [Rhizorhapis suberifaciens]